LNMRKTYTNVEGESENVVGAWWLRPIMPG